MNGHLSLFSGIGGLDLAAEWAGFRTVAFVERDPFCRRVLARHWPGVPIFDDVHQVTADSLRDGLVGRKEQDERPDESKQQASRRRDAERLASDRGSIVILSGGFPCQPHSIAGKRKASGDDRDLWHECARITGEFRPRWAVFENVPGLLSSEGGTFFAKILGDLAALGYRVDWGIWGADDVGAVHRRDRVFIVANLADAGSRRLRGARRGEVEQQGRSEIVGASENVADAGYQGIHERRQPEYAGIGDGEQGGMGNDGLQNGIGSTSTPVADASGAGREERDIAAVSTGSGHCPRGVDPRRDDRSPESRLGYMDDGIPRWMAGPAGTCWQQEPQVQRVASGVTDRASKLRALGNAVVPQQAYPLFRAIATIEGIA